MAVVKTGAGGRVALGVGRYLGWNSGKMTVDTSRPSGDASGIKLVHSRKMDPIKIINYINLLVNESNNWVPDVIKWTPYKRIFWIRKEDKGMNIAFSMLRQMTGVFCEFSQCLSDFSQSGSI